MSTACGNVIKVRANQHQLTNTVLIHHEAKCSAGRGAQGALRLYSQSRQGFILLKQQLWKLAETVLVEATGYGKKHKIKKPTR